MSQTSVKLCGDFKKGSCTRDRCIYAHNVNENAAPDAQVCGDFRRGNCTRASCKYIHNTNENATVQRSSGGPEYQAPPEYAQHPQAAQTYGMGVPMPYMQPQYQVPPPVQQYVPDIRPQTPMPLACKFPACKYVHNVNPAARRGAEPCPDFPNPCTQPNCRNYHNVNTAAGAGAPMCGDYTKVFQGWEESSMARFDRMPALAAPAMPAMQPPLQPPMQPPGQPQYAPQPMPLFFPDQRMANFCPPSGVSAPYDASGQVGGKRRMTESNTWTICGDFLRDKCTRDSCTYVHNSNASASRDAELCGDFSNGSCTRESCKYIHNTNPNAAGIPVSKKRQAAS
ncbi:hypothetical protein CYMTET_29026 [Cymbomonas tetramitiformis]|uniref:C3H1-type domain-containing protein n=1 Tax=Cymbomonas tetramitiformis TaxID=36881 RepID=A0AAE0KVL8_9CHLO|nr:hypothetical protein CYMTET_29026 [Cymbomonas tetramitiformis]|eukprot:gene8408-9991_t